MSRLWVSGYRSYELGIFQSKDPKVTIIKEAIKQFIRQRIDDGVDWIITGPQLGVEQWTIEVTLELKKDFPELKVALMLPFAQFGSQWNEDNQNTLTQLTTAVDFSDQVSDAAYHSPQQLKNYQQFMLAHTDEALLVYDPENEGKPGYDLTAANTYAEQHPYPISLIDFDQLQETADEYFERQNQRKYEDS